MIQLAITDPDTKEVCEVELDLNDVDLVWNEKHNNIVEISEGIKLKMRYPTFDDLTHHIKNSQKGDMSFEILKNTIEYVFEDDNQDEITKLSDQEDAEIEEFLENIPSKGLRNIKEFFNTMPKLEHKINYINKEGKEKTATLSGLRDFLM